MLLALHDSPTEAQVINFDTPGGISGFVNYSGQGAYSDPGNNYWNPIVQNGTTSAGLLSDGSTSSPITLTVSSDSVFSAGQGTQGTPSGLQAPFVDSKPGPKTCTLNNVPAGCYYLYLYGINGDAGDCNRGTTFTLGEATLSTVNSTAAYNSFIQGNDYVVFKTIVGPGSGSITFTYQANANVQVGGVANNIGNLNGVQLVATNFVGAAVPFTTYEAEAGTLGGGAGIVALTAPPTTKFSSPQLEASGHAYVQLTGAGQSVSWVNNTGQAITAFNIRASIPPTADGNGQTATLDLYVNGVFRQAVTLSSRQTWVYESSSDYDGMNHTSSGGTFPNPHVFWDESHAFFTGAPLAPGSTIMLKVDSTNAATFYDLDCIDLETPPAPFPQPANSLSIVAYGAVANNSSSDSTTAIQNCINAAIAQGKTVWIPSGAFYLNSTTMVDASNATITGAGPWYSTLYTNPTLPSGASGIITHATSNSCTVRNLHIDGNARDNSYSTGGNSSGFSMRGNNWVVDNIWIQHHEGFWAAGTNGLIENCRITNAWADGININSVNSGAVGNQLTVQNNFVRGSGDDAIAINSVANSTSDNMQNPKVINNTTVAPWWANGMGIYGGVNDLVENNLICDSVKEHGLYVGVFSSNAPLQTALIKGNTILRGGSFGYGLQMRGLSIGATSQPVTNVTADSNIVNDAMFVGIGIQTSTGTIVQNCSVDSPGLDGIAVLSGATGNATLDNNFATNVPAGRSQFINNPGQANFPVVFTNEGEFLDVASITAGRASSIILAPQFSNGAAAYLNSNAVGNQATYVIPSVPAGTYNVTIGVKKLSGRGIWQLAIGPAGGGFTNLGTPQDEYAASPSFTSFNLGTWAPGSSSDKWFRFTITGKNASSAGYDMAIDYIQLTPQ